MFYYSAKKMIIVFALALGFGTAGWTLAQTAGGPTGNGIGEQTGNHMGTMSGHMGDKRGTTWVAA